MSYVLFIIYATRSRKALTTNWSPLFIQINTNPQCPFESLDWCYLLETDWKDTCFMRCYFLIIHRVQFFLWWNKYCTSLEIQPQVLIRLFFWSLRGLKIICATEWISFISRRLVKVWDSRRVSFISYHMFKLWNLRSKNKYLTR